MKTFLRTATIAAAAALLSGCSLGSLLGAFSYSAIIAAIGALVVIERSAGRIGFGRRAVRSDDDRARDGRAGEPAARVGARVDGHASLVCRADRLSTPGEQLTHVVGIGREPCRAENRHV